MLHSVVRTTGNTAHAYADRVAEGAQDALSAARYYTRHGANALADGSRQVLDRTLQASAAGGDLVRRNPVKTLVIGLAAAALVAVAVTAVLEQRRLR